MIIQETCTENKCDWEKSGSNYDHANDITYVVIVI